jgi:glyoxylase-like metal-dependent hydrolase (beta-lactamase superfamily II)
VPAEPTPTPAGLHRLDLGRVNAFLLDLPAGRVLVDTGYEHTVDLLRRRLDEAGGSLPDLIAVTHSHPDHAGGVAELAETTGVPVAMHPRTAELLADGNGGAPLKPGPFTDAQALGETNDRLIVPPYDGAVELTPGEPVPGFPGLLTVDAPGHAQGQIALLASLDDGTRVLVAADAAANLGRLRLVRVAEDHDLALESARGIAALDFDVAAFGHGIELGPDAAWHWRDIWPPRPA